MPDDIEKNPTPKHHRGQAQYGVAYEDLVEIGGGFRMPEVIAQAGAKLIEVGTTNRTRPDDYQQALDAGADVILLVDGRSNQWAAP